jgi:Zn-dependent peptidase ImmA (M78 family)
MIHHLTTGHTFLTVQTAMELQTVLGIDAMVLIKQEMHFRARSTEEEQTELFAECKKWLLHQPSDELRRLGYLKSQRFGIKMINECLAFYGVVSPLEWEAAYVNKFAAPRFRKNKHHQGPLASLAAWIRIAELTQQKLKLPPYNREAFRASLRQIQSIAHEHQKDFAARIADLCRIAGVAVIYSAGHSKVPVSGAARWFGGRPLIQITDGCKTYDHFWFTFFHAAGHILLHSTKDFFLEECPYQDDDRKKETEANEFAARRLVSKPLFKSLSHPVTVEQIELLANRYEMDPGIVTATLQNLDLVPKTFENRFKKEIYWDYVIKSTEGRHAS